MININLTPGTTTFTIWAGSSPSFLTPHYGLNLFFNGNNSLPGISVFAPLDTSPSPPFPSFSSNSSADTATLTERNGAPGAGTLTFTDGLTVVTLTDYFWSHPDVSSTDRVQGFDSVPGAGNDYVGQFTLEVSGVVPEPASLTLLGLGLGTFVHHRRQRGLVRRPS